MAAGGLLLSQRHYWIPYDYSAWLKVFGAMTLSGALAVWSAELTGGASVAVGIIALGLYPVMLSNLGLLPRWRALVLSWKRNGFPDSNA